MSVQTEVMVLHYLRYSEGDGVTVSLSESSLEPGQAVDDFTSSLQQSFQHKSNRSYACFAEEDVVEKSGEPMFPALLAQLNAGKKSFNEFSVDAARLLASAVNKYGLVCQGYLYFIKYKYLASDYILIGVLEPQESIAFSDVMHIETVRYVDLDKLGLVARIDLSDYDASPELKRYISFIKGRAGRKVADFFLEFLSANESTSQKVQNDALVNAVSNFVVDSGLSRQESKEVKQGLAEYCKSQIKAGEELDIRAIANCMPQEQSEGFYHFLANDLGLPESFPPHQSSLRALTKYVGSGGGLTISFDEKLLGERISYDKATDTLTITGLPPNLKDQLLRNNS